MQNFPSQHQQNTPDRSHHETVKTGNIDIESINTLRIGAINIKGILKPRVGVINTEGIDTVRAVPTGVESVETVEVRAVNGFKRPDVIDVILLLLPLCAFILWSISLQKVSLDAMNDLGLISVLSPRILVALAMLVVSYAFTLGRKELRVPLLALQLICLIVILYGTPDVIEGMTGTIAFRHAGYTEYIMRTGTVAPNLDIYFDIPGFFVLSAFFTKVFGYSTILSYEGWAPVFNNLIYWGPMYMIFTSITTNKRLVWLSLLFFYLTKWIGQDYFSPQGFDFFLYLVIIAILLKWFRMPGKQPIALEKNASFRQKFRAWLHAPDPFPPARIGTWQRRGMLCLLIAIFGLVVCSHPLTPFLTILSVSALVLFRRCRPFWLPILLVVMTVAWDFTMAHPYLSQHVNDVITSLGDLTGNVPTSITTGKMVGTPLYQIVGKTRLAMTLLLWSLAFLGAIKRLRQGYQDITYILPALAVFPMIAAQNYGGEMSMRIYLFAEPFMAFFAAALFFDHTQVIVTLIPAKSMWRTAAIIAASVILFVGFLFARYGDERVNYITDDEWNAVQYIYQIAPNKSLVMDISDNSPFYFKNYEKYHIRSLTYVLPEKAVTNMDTKAIIEFFEKENNPYSYLLFSQEQQNRMTVWESVPGDLLQRLEASLLKTGKFRVVYHNADTQILQFIK